MGGERRYVTFSIKIRWQQLMMCSIFQALRKLSSAIKILTNFMPVRFLFVKTERYTFLFYASFSAIQIQILSLQQKYW